MYRVISNDCLPRPQWIIAVTSRKPKMVLGPYHDEATAETICKGMNGSSYGLVKVAS
jgi:hypothetical protein